MAAVRGGAAGHGKSGAPLTRGCFLLVVMVVVLVVMMMTVVDEAAALTTLRQPDPSLGVPNVKFRGARSAFMHPTATAFSPPIKNNNNNAGRRPQSFGGGSVSSSLMPPGVASRAPSTRTQEPGPAGPAGPALMPETHVPRPHTWVSGAGSHPQQPTFMSFGTDGDSAPRLAKLSGPKASAAGGNIGGGWAGMDGPAVQRRRASMSHVTHPRAHITAGITDPDPATHQHRTDTFGVDIIEDLSHVNDRPSGRWQAESRGSLGRFPSSSEGGARGREFTHTPFGGGFPQASLRPIDEDEEMVVEDEYMAILLDLNATSEYEREDYNNNHDYGQTNHSWRSPEHTPSTTHEIKPLTFQDVMAIMNLASQADLHALLDQRGITFDELRYFLNSGAKRKDVLEFLKPPPPLTTLIATITTTITPPELSHHALDAPLIEEGYQDDVRDRASLSEDDHEGEGDDIEQDRREQTKKNRKKGRRGKGGRRNKKRRKGKKGQKEDVSDVAPSPIPPTDNTASTDDPEAWIPSTPRTLPEAPLATTYAATTDILPPTTQPPASGTKTTSPPSMKTSEVSIVSVTLVEAPSDPHHKKPDQTTLVENATPTKRHNIHNTTHLWGDPTHRKLPRPLRPSREPDQTVNEIEKVNFVREEQRDDYVFPLRGLLIISGLMGALVVFTLVVLISYAVIKCSKKPVVNNYQVSEQQKPAGT